MIFKFTFVYHKLFSQRSELVCPANILCLQIYLLACPLCFCFPSLHLACQFLLNPALPLYFQLQATIPLPKPEVAGPVLSWLPLPWPSSQGLGDFLFLQDAWKLPTPRAAEGCTKHSSYAQSTGKPGRRMLCKTNQPR